MKECFNHEPFKKLAVLIDSRLENIRLFARTLFNNLYKNAGKSMKENADASVKNNAWGSISKVWNV